ncbi:hypothetical protein RQX78_003801 [Salmonella enterica]|nr:hypothetical protein [Salmonella enterica]
MLKPVSSSHFHIPRFHSHRSESAETRHTAHRIIQRLSNSMRSASSRWAERKSCDNGIQERSVKTYNQSITNSQKKSETPSVPPGSDKMRTGPLSRERLSDGEYIDVSRPGITADIRSSLEKDLNISITPVYIGGKEIGYVFGSTPENVDRIYLRCHGYGSNKKEFIKPSGVSLKFIVPENTIALARVGEDIQKVAEGTMAYNKPDEQIYDSESIRPVRDYSLEAVTDRLLHQPEWMGYCVKQLKDMGKPLNVMVLNPNATGIRLSDVIQGLNDTFKRMPELVCGHCRPITESATTLRV